MDNHPANHFKYIHDIRMVWTSKRPFRSMWKAIAISWGIAFFEYCFMIPANRIGYGKFNAFQLKTIQEVITLVIFVVFSVLYLKEQVRWNHIVSFVFILGAVYFMFKK